MIRTRKWEYVAQEAKRLADLGLKPVEIAKRLDVARQTIQRWMQAGKLKDTRRHGRSHDPVVETIAPGKWGETVRASFALDATDEELVRMGELSLKCAYDAEQPATVRMAAMGRFQSIVKQLALVARNADEAPADESKSKAPTKPTRRPGDDPRRGLMAVK